MDLVLGTGDGVWSLTGDTLERVALPGVRVHHVAWRDEVVLAAAPRDGLYRVAGGAARRVWEGDARSCAIGADGAYYVGMEPAMIARSDDAGETWRRLDAIDALPTRGEWTFPPPPHEPHVLSIDFLADEALLAGVEVGGAIVSADRGESWAERNDGIYVDVHSVRPAGSDPDRVYAVTGNGFYASEDDGRSWERRMTGMDNGYTIGLSVHPERAGQVLVTSGDRPPGLNGRIYRSDDGGHGWRELTGDPLPGPRDRAPAPLLTAGGAWLGGADGRLLRSTDLAGWEVVATIPAAINALAAPGRSSSVMH
jgi:photosystem II stability/assembly factor-like uncharacterized protein